jgi:hypothetical protein
LLHNNAPANKAASFCQFLTPKMLQILSNPHSPDLSLPEYCLFSKLKIKLKGLYFAGVAEIQEAVPGKLTLV